MKCCIFRWTDEWMEDGQTERWIKFAKQKSSFHLSIVLFDKSILRMINFRQEWIFNGYNDLNYELS